MKPATHLLLRLGSVFLALVLLFQVTGAKAAFRNKKSRWAQRTTVADLAEMNYDIKRLNFNIHVSDTSTRIVGDVTTAAVVTASSLSAYVFELDSTITLDSARFNGAVTTVSRTGDVATINLGTSLPSGSYFTAEIWYHGIPAASGGFFNALTHSVSVGTNLVYSLSDPYAAKNWWPAKQCLDDKIDTVDMYVTVPSGVIDGSNGVLLSIDSTTTPGHWQYHWQTHYPIDYYLISIAVARYAEYKTWHHFAGSTDSMLIQNFFYDTVSFNPLYKPNFDRLGQIIDFYDSLYGRYPFWQEKYGVCYTSLPGGMEHQTMTTIGVPYTYIIAHELCHQWFGDHVTYRNWGDVWLSEGFATFSEQLFLNRFWSPAAALAHRQSYLSTATGEACGSVFVTDTAGPSTIFDETLVYARGQAVVTMLRYAAPQDSLFFKALRTYQQTFAFSNAATADLENIVDSIYGTNMDTFFNQWIYGQGFPEYNISWNQTGSSVLVRLVQTTSCPAVTPLFKNYVELELKAAGTDTIVKVYNNVDTQYYTFTWAPTMDSVILNPDVWTLCKLNGAVLHNTTLAAPGMQKTGISVFPNPATNNWEVVGLTADASLQLSDMSGKVIWTGIGTTRTSLVPAKKLSSGEYILKITAGVDTQYLKLTRW